MSLDEMKSEIIAIFKQELLKLHFPIEDRDIRSTLNGDIWAIWIEQDSGLDTSVDKFLVNLADLNERVDHSAAIGYRVHRWITEFK